MNRFGIVMTGMLLASLSYGGTLLASGQAAPTAIGHGSFPVKVNKTLDSSKLKEGDAIEVETTGSFKLPDGTLVAKGSKLLGNVVASKARSKGDPDSQLILSFDKLNVSSKKQLSVKGAIQAVYPPAEDPMGPNMASAGASAGGSGAGAGSGGVGLTNATNGSNTQSSSPTQAVVDVKATGVQGIRDLQLDNGTLTSKGKNVKLGGGVRMIINAEFLSWSGIT